jgi:iron-sulfur cluster repair protein YtfE (RIC family)
MRDRANTTAIDTQTTVNEVIRMYPDSVSVFNQMGIDACCGGDASLAEAARRDGVDLESLLARLDAVVAVGGRNS